MPLLTSDAIHQQLSSLSGWRAEERCICRDYAFADFVEAMQFVKKVAIQAEAAGHHPDIDIRYNKVRLCLTSHDSGGVTERDISLARSLNAE